MGFVKNVFDPSHSLLLGFFVLTIRYLIPQFLTQLTLLLQKTRNTGSFYITMKKCEYLDIESIDPSLVNIQVRKTSIALLRSESFFQAVDFAAVSSFIRANSTVHTCRMCTRRDVRLSNQEVLRLKVTSQKSI